MHAECCSLNVLGVVAALTLCARSPVPSRVGYKMKCHYHTHSYPLARSPIAWCTTVWGNTVDWIPAVDVGYLFWEHNSFILNWIISYHLSPLAETLTPSVWVVLIWCSSIYSCIPTCCHLNATFQQYSPAIILWNIKAWKKSFPETSLVSFISQDSEDLGYLSWMCCVIANC